MCKKVKERVLPKEARCRWMAAKGLLSSTPHSGVVWQGEVVRRWGEGSSRGTCHPSRHSGQHPPFPQQKTITALVKLSFSEGKHLSPSSFSLLWAVPQSVILHCNSQQLITEFSEKQGREFIKEPHIRRWVSHTTSFVEVESNHKRGISVCLVKVLRNARHVIKSQT